MALLIYHHNALSTTTFVRDVWHGSHRTQRLLPVVYARLAMRVCRGTMSITIRNKSHAFPKNSRFFKIFVLV